MREELISCITTSLLLLVSQLAVDHSAIAAAVRMKGRGALQAAHPVAAVATAATAPTHAAILLLMMVTHETLVSSTISLVVVGGGG